MTRFRILGPLRPAVTAGRDRIVLAMLLLHADRVVSVAELVRAVWDEDPPPTARAQLQACVSRLRRALPAGVIDTDPEQARRAWTAALVAFRAMGVPEQYEVERRLAAMAE